ncbi:MAG TPA: glycosyltransferase, partial [Beijerinckiaceae bacterium]|nr:glycosyltransferase [Beijerinckiaceae bacterium]
QHACALLALEARYPVLLFLDADVRLRPGAVARAAAFLDSSGAGLVSGFPHQVTVTLLEKLLIPLVHFILLGFLPIDRMRRSLSPAYAAGCGQLMVTRRDAYDRAGGHAAICATLHDGIRLPRAFRRAGIASDLFDATSLVSCRMYNGAHQVWNGLAKNATEGLGAPSRILPITVLLLAGQVLPFVLLVTHPGPVTALAAFFAWLPRMLSTRRFRQPLLSAVLHPVGVLLLLAIQWHALTRSLLGRSSTWKGRAYAPADVLVEK